MGESIAMFKRIELVSEDVKSVTNAQKAQILMNALPYIKKYSGKIVVVKYGGNAMINEDLKKSVMGDIVLLNLIGVKVVLVHGGGPHIKETLNRLGMESKFLNGLRVTDAETMKVVQMVLAGQVNKDLVNLIGTIGGKAIGLCGLDDQMIKSRSRAMNWAMSAALRTSTFPLSRITWTKAISRSFRLSAPTPTVRPTTSTPIRQRPRLPAPSMRNVCFP